MSTMTTNTNMTGRKLSQAEARSLSDLQKAYLARHPLVVTLQPHVIPCEALYQTQHGAVTIDRARELDEIQSRYLAGRAAAQRAPVGPVVDHYSAQEDDFIDRHGFSTILS
jgi:hypothetical protein